MLIFNKAKFIEVEGAKVYKEHKPWVDLLDGKEVKPVGKHMGEVEGTGFAVLYKWCIESIDENLEKDLMELHTMVRSKLFEIAVKHEQGFLTIAKTFYRFGLSRLDMEQKKVDDVKARIRKNGAIREVLSNIFC